LRGFCGPEKPHAPNLSDIALTKRSHKHKPGEPAKFCVPGGGGAATVGAGDPRENEIRQGEYLTTSTLSHLFLLAYHFM
jgi:hypothetical protein